MTNGNSAEREAFEKWWERDGWSTKDEKDVAWDAWKAALSVCADGGKDSMDTLVAVLNAIGYTEEFAEAHPNLKVSEGVKLFLQQRADGGKGEAQPVLPIWWSDFITNICDIPGRTSPEGEPEAIIATIDELRHCALASIEAIEDAPASECAPREAQPVAISDDHAHALYKLAHMTGFVGWLNELRKFEPLYLAANKEPQP